MPSEATCFDGDADMVRATAGRARPSRLAPSILRRCARTWRETPCRMRGAAATILRGMPRKCVKISCAARVGRLAEPRSGSGSASATSTCSSLAASSANSGSMRTECSTAISAPMEEESGMQLVTITCRLEPCMSEVTIRSTTAGAASNNSSTPSRTITPCHRCNAREASFHRTNSMSIASPSAASAAASVQTPASSTKAAPSCRKRLCQRNCATALPSADLPTPLSPQRVSSRTSACRLRRSMRTRACSSSARPTKGAMTVGGSCAGSGFSSKNSPGLRAAIGRSSWLAPSGSSTILSASTARRLPAPLCRGSDAEATVLFPRSKAERTLSP
mmetsp:Transcript_26296/g.66747  ORF Transcript_26296/g.66747 Transcript_26296/m.66747 type:complete len:333 (+) Transcript_26296:827-1825(+)